MSQQKSICLNLERIRFISIFIYFILFLVCNGIAQGPQAGISSEQTVEYLNKKLGKEFLIELAEDNQQMVISFFKNGMVYKVDRVYLMTLDAGKVSFSQEEKALILRCRNADELEGKFRKFSKGCFEREIIEKNTIGTYGRTNLEVGTDKKKIDSLQKAFIHLIKLAQEEEYHSSIPFE